MMEKKIDEFQNSILTNDQLHSTAEILLSDLTLQTLFESVAEAVVIINSEGRIIITNQRFKDLFGYTRPELFGKTLEIILPAQIHEMHRNYVKQFFKAPKIRPMGSGFDLIGIAKSGNEIPIEISLSYLKTSLGVLAMAFISDITKRKEAEKELLLKNQELDAYAHTIAHDLKSSLNGVVGFTTLLLEDDEMDAEKQKSILNYMYEGGMRMNRIIESLLFLAKIDKKKVERSILPISDLVDNVLKRLDSEIKSSGAIIQLDGKAEIVHAIGYGPWVEEILYNLVGNAIKHGGEKPQIRIGCFEDSQSTSYFVQNLNTTISEKNIEDLKLNIQHIKKNSESGFGLSIIHRILQKLDGNFDIRSSEADGVKFIFSLPKFDTTNQIK